MRPIVKLGEAVDFSQGIQVPIEDQSMVEKSGLVRFLRIVDFTQGNQEPRYVENFGDRYFVKKDDISMVRYGTPGFVCSGLEGIIANNLFKITPKHNDIYKKYLYFYFQSPYFLNYLDRESSGVAMKAINFGSLKNIEIPLPPLETQKAIVAKLDQIFAELDQTKLEIQKNLDNTGELWKSALNQAFQGDWEMKKLEEIYDITSSKRVFQKDWRTSGVPFYRAREIVKLAENGFVDNELFITEEMYEEYGKKYGLPKENDIMVTGVGTIGICYFVKKTDKFYFKDGNILWFKHNFEGINSHFVEYLFKSELLKSQINNGASTVVATLTIEKAKGLTIPVPPLSEQEKIVEHLDQVSKEVKALKSQYQSQLDNLEELKKSVLDKAFKGELGVEKTL